MNSRASQSSCLAALPGRRGPLGRRDGCPSSIWLSLPGLSCHCHGEEGDSAAAAVVTVATMTKPGETTTTQNTERDMKREKKEKRESLVKIRETHVGRSDARREGRRRNRASDWKSDREGTRETPRVQGRNAGHARKNERKLDFSVTDDAKTDCHPHSDPSVLRRTPRYDPEHHRPAPSRTSSPPTTAHFLAESNQRPATAAPAEPSRPAPPFPCLCGFPRGAAAPAAPPHSPSPARSVTCCITPPPAPAASRRARLTRPRLTRPSPSQLSSSGACDLWNSNHYGAGGLFHARGLGSVWRRSPFHGAEPDSVRF